ncbi:Glutathione-regulated potassium-efflux system protein KefB [Candidatus Anstonella stagnisolia]|nr:Glutathione-regulated potassium-efflux system protein KefB [Candidatus Anstonella stagnisolia]
MRFRQPPVIGLLIMGALIGPNMLGIVQSQDLIMLFFQLGAVFLLFEIGVEFSVSRLLSSGFKAVSVSLLKITALFAFGYQIGVLLSLGFLPSLYLGFIFSISSTAILTKLAEQKGTAGRDEMSFLFTMLIIEDIFAVAALTFLSSLSKDAAISLESTLVSLLFALFVLGFSYHVLSRILMRISNMLIKYKTEDTAIFLALALCAMFSIFAYWLGLSPTIGAFIAGDLMSMLPICSKLERPMKPFVLTFTGLFFLSVGMLISPASIAANIGQDVAIVLLFLIASFSIVSLLTYLSGFSSSSAIFAGSSMVVLGEFSLLLAMEASRTISGFDFIGMTSLAVLATAIFSSFALERQGSILSMLHSRSPSRLRMRMHKLSAYFGEVIADFEPQGRFFTLLVQHTRKILRYVFHLVAFAGVSFVLIFFFGRLQLFGMRLFIPIALVTLLAMLYEIIRIVLQLAAILTALSKSVVRFGSEGDSFATILARNSILMAISLAIALFIPAALELASMPKIFYLLNLPFFAFAALLLWDLLSHTPKLRRR